VFGSIQTVLALAIGFALAGLLSTGYQLFTERPASLRLIQCGPSLEAFVAIPFLVFAAPFLIVRDVVRGGAAEAPLHRFELAMLAGIAAGVWSLMSGTVFLMVVEALTLPA
jgi:hypothetical protein